VVDDRSQDHIAYAGAGCTDIQLDRCLVYLGSLKALPPVEVMDRMAGYLKRFDLETSRHKKVKELSKGMQQKAQLIATLIHAPELIILTSRSVGWIDQRNSSRTYYGAARPGRDHPVSTHQMHQVESCVTASC
jgi:ABC-2 type transport system ATP-binding protein